MPLIKAGALGSWALVVGVFLSGCGQSTPLLSNAHPSAEALATAVLQSLQQRDVASLRNLALNEEEFREHVWPELPAARPERNLPVSYVWGDLHQKSESFLAQTVGEYGGRRYTLISVRFAGESTTYPSYVVHRETVVRARDESGREADLRLFGSSVVKDGNWKVFSYVTDD